MSVTTEAVPGRTWPDIINRWLMILGKLPKLVVMLKLMKATKPLMLVGSMVVSMAAYALATHSWVFGIGLVYLLFVHEGGHVWAARRHGLDASWPIFIPFLGAAIFIKKFDSVRSEAFVAVAGPIVGTLGALIFVLPWAITGDHIWLGLVYFGLVLNAFNMIPLRPLDGGRMTAICGPWFKVVGFGLLGMLTLIIHQPVMLYVWVLIISDIAFPQWWRTGTGITLTVLMAALMLMGYSDQPWFIDVMDTIFATAMTGAYYAGEREVSRGRPDPFAEHYEDDTSVRASERYSWAFGWAGMMGFFGMLLWLIATIISEIPH